jgi:hypothetical protein
MVAIRYCGRCPNLGFAGSPENGVSRLTSRVTMANRKLADNRHSDNPPGSLRDPHPSRTHGQVSITAGWSKENLYASA